MTKDEIVRLARRVSLTIGFALVLGVHLLLTTYYLDHSLMGTDEGFYAIAARSAIEGKIPYRDFAYTQMPLLPYLNGMAMKLIGFGLLEQRICNIFWSCLGVLGLIIALRQRLDRWEPGLMAAFCVVTSPYHAELMSIGTTHGAASMFMSLAAAAVISTLSLKWRTLAFGVLGTMAVGTRLSCAPVLAVLELILILEARGWRSRLMAALVPATVLAAGILPFFITAPGAMLFNVWEYHLASVFNRRCPYQFIEWWRNAPAAILIWLAALAKLPLLIKKREWSPVLLLLAALLGLGLPMIPKSAYGQYVAPIMLFASMAGITALWSAGVMVRNPFRHVIWLLPSVVLHLPLPFTLASTSQEVKAVGQYIRDHVQPGRILTPYPIVAVEAGRKVTQNTEMGMFAATFPADRKKAHRFHYTTIPDLARIVARGEPAAIVKLIGSSKVNFRWAIPSLRRQPDKVYGWFEKALKEHYQLAIRYKTMEILVPRNNE